MKNLLKFVSNYSNIIRTHPVSTNLIETHETELKFKFSDEYKEFQKKFGVIKVPAHAIVILGCTEDMLDKKHNIINLSNYVFEINKKLGAYCVALYKKDNLIILYNNNDNGVYVFKHNETNTLASFSKLKLTLEEIIIIILKTKIEPPSRQIKQFFDLLHSM